jgi:hypothetical protein
LFNCLNCGSLNVSFSKIVIILLCGTMASQYVAQRFMSASRKLHCRGPISNERRLWAVRDDLQCGRKWADEVKVKFAPQLCSKTFNSSNGTSLLDASDNSFARRHTALQGFRKSGCFQHLCHQHKANHTGARNCNFLCHAFQDDMSKRHL